MYGKRYAILDTDFVSKTCEIYAASNHLLADLVLEFPDYEFCCHEMLLAELDRHGTRPAQAWVFGNIETECIKKYTDEDILNSLSVHVGEECYSMYLRFLKMGCDIYDKDFFDKNYAPVIELMDGKVDRHIFLKNLDACDKKIGGQQSLGEKKAYVLLQMLRFINGENVFMFCSDDFGARCAMADQSGIPCVSIVAVFLKLKNMGISRETVEPYFNSYIEMCYNHRQMKLRVWELHGSYRIIRIDLSEVLDGLYGDRFSLMLNGDLLIKN